MGKTRVHPEELELRTDPRAAVPLYRQLSEQLAEAIDRGRLRPMDALPAEGALAARLGVSRGTVRQAYEELERAGRVVRRQGAGTFVARRKATSANRLLGFHEEMRLAGMAPSSRTLRQERLPAEREVAGALEVEAGSEVVFLERLFLADGTPCSLSRAWLPAGRCAGLEEDDLEAGSLYELLERKYGLFLAWAEKTVEAVAADEALARRLGVAPGAPLLYVRKLAYDVHGAPVEYQVGYWRGDLYRFYVREER